MRILLKFEKRIATNIGLNEAIIINYLEDEISRAEITSKNKYDARTIQGYVIHEGRCWVKATIASLCEVFPFWSDKTIKRALQRLESDGVLDSIRVNEHPFDNTKSYRISRKVLNDLTSKV